MKNQRIWLYVGYFGVIYLILIALIGFGFPLAQQYAKPIAAWIFPINSHNSMMKSLGVTTAMYWLMVGFYMFISTKKSSN